jgi:hypothetical protein
MNNKVRNAPANDPVRIAVYDASGSRVDVPSEENNGDSVVWIDPSDDTHSTSYVIRMDSNTVEWMSDLQYVVETSPFGGLFSSGSMPASGSPSSESPVSSFVGASVGGGVLCNGKRAHARGKASHVKYESATNMTQALLAGWSEYHGPVTLTPRILFKIRDDYPEPEREL